MSICLKAAEKMSLHDQDELERGRDGLYALCFKNSEMRTAREIENIFSEYGNVQSVRLANQNPGGMVFVRYREYEEAKNCLDRLRDSQRFKMKSSGTTFGVTERITAGRKSFHGDKNFNNGNQSDAKNHNNQKHISDRTSFKNDRESEAKNVSHKQNSDRTSGFGKPRHESGEKNFGHKQQPDRKSDFGKPRHESEAKDFGHRQHSDRKSDFRKPHHESEAKNFGHRQQPDRTSDFEKPRHESETKDLERTSCSSEKLPGRMNESRSPKVGNFPPQFETDDLIDMLNELHISYDHVTQMTKTGINTNIHGREYAEKSECGWSRLIRHICEESFGIGLLKLNYIFKENDLFFSFV
ncbi:hypothetical protein C0J52_06327 [Blattella germanica]|nr:hypothetical protein C0J52_06327 [Blattella germanica]